jgi:hypothetical protein
MAAATPSWRRPTASTWRRRAAISRRSSGSRSSATPRPPSSRTGKLAAFAYAFEHLEISAYEHLCRVALAAADEEVATVAERILGEERAAAETLRSDFDVAVRASPEAVGAGTTS